MKLSVGKLSVGTRQEWLTCEDPMRMLEFLSPSVDEGHLSKVSDHKLRLWIEACRFLAPPNFTVSWDIENPVGLEGALRDWSQPGRYADRIPLSLRAALLRDIVGNPFLPLSVYSWYANIKPASVTGKLNFRREWVSATVRAIALGAYNDRDWGRLPVLADALEDADCNEPLILEHLKSTGPHVRGCWVLDLILDKEKEAKEDATTSSRV